MAFQFGINEPIDPTYLDKSWAYINPALLAYELTAQEWQDWQSTYKPIELQLMSQLSYNNPQILSDAVREAAQVAEQTTGTMEGIASRQNRAMGIVPTEQAEKTSRRLMDLNRALTIAGAENQARANIRAQDQQILFGLGTNVSAARTTGLI